jgi:acyl phosphate:glycerol-3-phosphate acyltransferase
MSPAFPLEIALSTLLIAAAFGYLCGSIPFGLILTKMFDAGDLRSIGSGNIGATNVLRTGRKDLAAATLLLDALKGTFAVIVAGQFGPGPAMAAGVGAFLGHIFPVWLKFRGGKGVATFLGVTIGLDWRAAIGFALVWLAVAFATRYSSLAALVASVATPILLVLFGHPVFAAVSVALTCMLWWKHRENIGRLRAGSESRIGSRG